VLDDIWIHNVVLARRWQGGQEPYKMVARLAEECGELSAEVQLWEGAVNKVQSLGEPVPEHTAKEVMDVIRVALQICSYYGLERHLEGCIDQALQFAVREGTITEEEVAVRRANISRKNFAADA
jgi:NTP pyrophosphatase (non-canonical NTP hydrolase)